MSFSHFEKKVNMQFQEINRLKLKVTELEEYIEKLQFSLEKIKDDYSAVLCYTGFPNFSSLFAVFQYFRPKFKHVHYCQGPKSGNKKNSEKPGPKRKLALIDELFLVLVRLTVGLFLGDLSDRFRISTVLLSKIFTTWINFLYLELPLLFSFPSQTLIRKQMPKQFKAYRTTRIIIYYYIIKYNILLLLRSTYYYYFTSLYRALSSKRRRLLTCIYAPLLLSTLFTSGYIYSWNMNLNQRTFNYSMKNKHITSEKLYKKHLLEKVELVVKRMRWKALMYDADTNDDTTTDNHYGFKTKKCPPQHKDSRKN